MSKELDNIIEIAINAAPKNAETALQKAVAADAEGLSYSRVRDLAKEQLRNKIYEEIREELKNEIVKDAQDEIDKRANLKQIQEIKTLTVSGAILAVFVGLFVNQVTEIIAFHKGPILEVGTKSTWQWSLIFLAISTLITLGWFFGKALKIIKDYSEEKL